MLPQMPHYPLLVIDAGNSAVKFAAVARSGAAPQLRRSVPTAKLTSAMAKSVGAGCKSVTVSSVVPAVSRIIKLALPAAQFIGPRTKIEFDTSVDRRTIGSDRLANVAAAHARYGKNVVVASFGTAATFDLIDAKGVHRGGVIAPGWKAFADILPSRTALLPRVSGQRAANFLGRNTRAALVAGVSGGYAAMVSQIIARMQNEARVRKLHVVFTGGDASLMARILAMKAVTDPLLTLRGIVLLSDGIAREGRK